MTTNIYSFRRSINIISMLWHIIQWLNMFKYQKMYPTNIELALSIYLTVKANKITDKKYIRNVNHLIWLLLNCREEGSGLYLTHESYHYGFRSYEIKHKGSILIKFKYDGADGYLSISDIDTKIIPFNQENLIEKRMQTILN